MTISFAANTITLAGACGVEEVEDLLGLLEDHPGVSVDIQAATSIHTALWQALMVFKPQITGPAGSPAVETTLSALRTFFDRVQVT